MERSRAAVARSVHWSRAASVGMALLFVAALALAACGSGPATSQYAPPAVVTPQATPESSVVYVALGASDAVGVGADNPNTQGYVPILISRLPTGPRPPLNLGISGITLHDALTQELPQAVAYQPTLVTVWLLGNDFKDCVPLQQYTQDLNTLLDHLKTQTQAQVFVANAPDMSLLPAIQQRTATGACFQNVTNDQIRARVQQWNVVIAASVAQHGDVLVDLYTGNLAGHPDYISSFDGFHPSNQGYLKLADLFWQQITAHGAVPGK